jgi:hypothetical protein
VEFVTATLRCALEALSVAASDWLAGCDLVTPAWLERPRGWSGTGSVPIPTGCPSYAGLGFSLASRWLGLGMTASACFRAAG